MRDDFSCECFLGNEYVDGEGYVMHSKHEFISWLTVGCSVIITLISFVRDTADIWG